jgi:hypothetical protein
LLLAACDPAGVPSDPSDASVRVEFEPTGEVTGHLQLARGLAADLVTAATDVAAELVGEPSRVAINGNGAGADFAVFAVPGAFEPGERPSASMTVDESTFAALRELGVESVDLTICRPFVPNDLDATPSPAADSTDCASFPLDAATGRLDVELEMRPRPARWFWSIAVLVVLLVCTVAAGCLVQDRPLSRRRRNAVLVAAGIGVVTFAVSIPLQPAAPHGDNIGVAGLLDGVALTIATWTPVAILPLAAACAGLGAMAVLPPRQRGTRYAYPRSS